MSDQDAILDYLRRMRAKDEEKNPGCLGLRTTTEVAEHFGLKTATARRRLHALANRELVEAFDGEGNGMGVAIYWAIAKAEPRS